MISIEMRHSFECCVYYNQCILIGIYSMQDQKATTRHGVTRKRSTKRLKHTGNLFRKNLQLQGLN